MRPTVFSADVLRQFLRGNRIATLPQLKQLLGTEADITVFRKLKELSYRTSYSHRGSFYTLDEIADFDDRGLWSFNSVWFSFRGTLVATAEDCVTQSKAGYFASELEELLHVPVKEPLLQLVAQGRIARQTVSDLYLYCAGDPPAQQRQLQARQALLGQAAAAAGVPPGNVSDELRVGQRSSCLPACSMNNNAVCTPVWNRFSWVAIARSRNFSVWTHTLWLKDDGSYWPRTWRWTGCGL